MADELTPEQIRQGQDIWVRMEAHKKEQEGMPEPFYWMHKMKCLPCGLHFIACSDYEDWPNTGTTRDQRLGEATGLIYCPECSRNGPMLHHREKVAGFIFQAVPGQAELVELRQ